MANNLLTVVKNKSGTLFDTFHFMYTDGIDWGNSTVVHT